MVKLHHEWQGMSCAKCYRFQKYNLKCDLDPDLIIANWNYCRNFAPNPWLAKTVILQMWNDHTQRFIRERQE
jgi:hypothetical protein